MNSVKSIRREAVPIKVFIGINGDSFESNVLHKMVQHRIHRELQSFQVYFTCGHFGASDSLNLLRSGKSQTESDPVRIAADFWLVLYLDLLHTIRLCPTQLLVRRHEKPSQR